MQVEKRIREDDLHQFGGAAERDRPLLLVLDRSSDPVTPLLSQWTYQAMVHEMLGVNNDRIMLKGAPGISKDLEELVLSSTNDAFFARHRYANFGELGSAVNGLVAGFAAETKSTSTKLQNEQIKSIEDIESFVERYPAYRQESANVAKHVAISSVWEAPLIWQLSSL